LLVFKHFRNALEDEGDNKSGSGKAERNDEVYQGCLWTVS